MDGYYKYIRMVLVHKKKMDRQLDKVIRAENKLLDNPEFSKKILITHSNHNTYEKLLINWQDEKYVYERMQNRLPQIEKKVEHFIFTFAKDEEEATILIYKYIDGFSAFEISEKMGFAYGTVRNRISKADKKGKLYYEKMIFLNKAPP